MRLNKALVFVLAALLFGVGLGAKTEQTKIGIVDLEQAVMSTKQGKSAREEFERKRREAEQKMMPLMEQYKEMMQEFESKKFVLSDDARFQKQLDIAEVANRIENDRKELEGQLKVDRERLLAPLQGKLQQIVDDIGKRENFSMILRRDTPGLLYAREALDVTDLVVEKFNKKG